MRGLRRWTRVSLTTRGAQRGSPPCSIERPATVPPVERDRRGGRTFSPNQWIWFWRVGMVVFGPGLILVGLLGEPQDFRMVFLGIVFLAIGLMMIGFWRQVQANRDAAVQPPPDSN